MEAGLGSSFVFLPKETTMIDIAQTTDTMVFDHTFNLRGDPILKLFFRIFYRMTTTETFRISIFVTSTQPNFAIEVVRNNLAAIRDRVLTEFVENSPSLHALSGKYRERAVQKCTEDFFHESLREIYYKAYHKSFFKVGEKILFKGEHLVTTVTRLGIFTRSTREQESRKVALFGYAT